MDLELNASRMKSCTYKLLKSMCLMTNLRGNRDAFFVYGLKHAAIQVYTCRFDWGLAAGPVESEGAEIHLAVAKQRQRTIAVHVRTGVVREAFRSYMEFRTCLSHNRQTLPRGCRM